ncbi:MAG: hypothetical protein ACOX2G_05835 [Bacillota bacterium]|jgi:hypothetical protein
MKLPNIRRMLPRRRRGMGTAAKVLLVALPVAAYLAGKMMGARMENDDDY